MDHHHLRRSQDPAQDSLESVLLWIVLSFLMQAYSQPFYQIIMPEKINDYKAYVTSKGNKNVELIQLISQLLAHDS